MREYKTGSAWAVWRWTDVDWRGATYLLRLHILKTPWFAVMLHWIMAADPAPDPHDHPVSFVSLTLRGGYTEWRPRIRRDLLSHPWRIGTGGTTNHRRLRFTRAADYHRITYAEPGTLTLVLAGPVRKTWGYLTREGWVHWRNYRDEHAR